MILSISLNTEVTRFAEIRRRICELYPDIDEETLADTLEGATNLNEAIEAVIASATDDETLANALKTRIEHMRARFSRLYESATAKRQAVREAMEQADLRKLVFAEFTVSLRKAARSVLIEQADQIPTEFWIPQDPKLDKDSVRKLLLAGSAVPGTTLSDDRLILSVRTN
jgi:hypothetical protein